MLQLIDTSWKAARFQNANGLYSSRFNIRLVEYFVMFVHYFKYALPSLCSSCAYMHFKSSQSLLI